MDLGLQEEPPITARQLRRAAADLEATDPRGGRGARWRLPQELEREIRATLDAVRRN